MISPYPEEEVNIDELELIKFKHNIQKFCDAVAEQVCGFTEKRSLKAHNMNVYWYGGEPLIDKEGIYSLLEKLS